MKREEMPRRTKLCIVLSSGRKLWAVNLKVLGWRRYSAPIRKETNWPPIVAIAAPAMPILKPKIRIGSKIMLIMAPTRVTAIERLGEPSARMTELSVLPTM